MTASASGSASIPSFAQHVGEEPGDLLDGVERELEVLGARPDGGRTFCGSVVASTNTTCPGGSSSVFSSAFDAAAEHVHLVEEVHLLAPPALEVGDPFDEVADLVDPVVRRGVHLDQVEDVPVGDRDAVLAHAARLAVVAEVRAVQRLGEDPRGRGLAGAAGPEKR